MLPIITPPPRTGFIDPFAGPFSSRSRKRVAIGSDSLSGAVYAPLSAALKARHGDFGLGLIPLDYERIVNAMPDAEFGKSPAVGYISQLPWSDPRRRKGLFGMGFYCENSVVDDSLSTDYFLLRDSVYGANAIDLYFEWTAPGQSFRVRQWPTEPIYNAIHVTQAEFPGTGVLHKLTLILDVDGTYESKGIDVQAITCAGSAVYFWAIEPHNTMLPHDGVDLVDLSTPSTSIAHWASMDAPRCREWMRAIRPDIFILNCGVNDRGISPLSDADSRRKAAEMSLWLSQMLERLMVCDNTRMLLVRPNDTVDWNTSGLKYCDQVLKAAARARGVAYLDDRDAMGSYADALANGLMLDQVHPNSVGNAKRVAAYMGKMANFY